MKKRLLLCSTIALLIFTAVSCKKITIDPKTLIGTWKGRIWTGKDSTAIGSTKTDYTIVFKADGTLTYEKKYSTSLTGNGIWTLNSDNFMEATNSDPFGGSATKLKAKATNTKIAGKWGLEGLENGFYLIKQ